MPTVIIQGMEFWYKPEIGRLQAHIGARRYWTLLFKMFFFSFRFEFCHMSMEWLLLDMMQLLVY